ncbi:MAG: DMT family transporter [Ignavibacteriaceae bacterium]|nr:DMT family transporter [Ignavibacteriaceae bacterium]
MDKKPRHFISILQALLVTFLWSTSFIIIKLALVEIPPITFAGLRYFLAFFCFLPFIFIKRKYLDEIKQLNVLQWKNLFFLGVVFYTFTQGAQFLGLSLLPSVTVSLILNFTPIVVAVMGIFLLKENPNKLQWIGVFLFLAGVLTYFLPISLLTNEIVGLAVMSVGVLANAASAVVGRYIYRKKDISPFVVTFISMGIGAIILLTLGLTANGFPTISAKNWLFLIWLAVINTAFAFTLWNLTLRTLNAMESSIINGTMLIQIAVLAWLFLGETITLQESLGMLIAALGAVLVQLKRK